MIDTQTKLKIVELRAGGKSMAKIAEEVGVAKQTVVDVCNDMREEIASLHAMQLEALYEEQKISTEERIRALSSVMGKIRKELESRSLVDVPTEKLVELFLKTSSTLEGSIVEPRFKSTDEQKADKEAREALNKLL
jgi:transposase-like protein